MLAGAVDAGEGLLMEQAHHAVLGGHIFHDLHGQLVVVAGGVGVGVDGGQLVLGRGHLVVLGLGQNAELPQLMLQVLHVLRHPGLDGAEVVVLQLLALGGFGAEEGPAGEEQVLPPLADALVDEEILLLRTHLADDPLDIGAAVAKELHDPHRLAADLIHGAEEGRLFVQGLAAVGAENGGDAQASVLDEGKGFGVPGGVAPGLEGGPQAAGGEGGGVGLAPDQLLAAELHDGLAAGGGRDEAVVLLGGVTGHGLEPVGEVGGAVFDGPVLHAFRDLIGGVQLERGAVLEALLPGHHGVAGDIFGHSRLVEDIHAEQTGDASKFLFLHKKNLLR